MWMVNIKDLGRGEEVLGLIGGVIRQSQQTLR